MFFACVLKHAIFDHSFLGRAATRCNHSEFLANLLWRKGQSLCRVRNMKAHMFVGLFLSLHRRHLLSNPGQPSADVLCELAPMHPDLARAPGSASFTFLPRLLFIPPTNSNHIANIRIVAFTSPAFNSTRPVRNIKSPSLGSLICLKQIDCFGTTRLSLRSGLTLTQEKSGLTRSTFVAEVSMADKSTAWLLCQARNIPST